MVKFRLYEDSGEQYNKTVSRNSEKLFTVPRHFEFSLDQEWSKEMMKTEGGIKSFIRELNQVVRLSGMQGWVRIIHPWRTTDHAKDIFREARLNNERWTNQGIHIWLKKNGIVPALDPEERYWYLSPHVHVVGYGWLIPSDEFHELTRVRGREGAVYVNLTERNNNPIINDQDYINLISYLLSHTFLQGDDYESRHSYSYGGRLHKFRVESSSIMHPVECPHEECKPDHRPVYKYRNVEERLEYNERNGEFQPKPNFKMGQGTLNPICTYEMLFYSETTYRGYPTGHPEFMALKIINNNPFPDAGEPPPKKDLHSGMAFDWAHNVYLGPDGKECSCSACSKGDISDIPLNPPKIEISEEVLEVDILKCNSEDRGLQDPGEDPGLNFMQKKIVKVADELISLGKPVTVDNLHAYLRQPVTIILSLVGQVVDSGYLAPAGDPNEYRRVTE